MNGTEIKSFNFPGGECQVNVSECLIKNQTTILSYINNSDEIIQLILAVDAVRRANNSVQIDLIVPYFPYARQDRVCNEGEAFSVKVMANLINNLKCKSVTIYDPHSQITVDSINNCKVVSLSDIVCSHTLSGKIKEENLLIVSPDNGAKDKVMSVGSNLEQPIICARKTRDTKTGIIKDISLFQDGGAVRDRDCIILDDICDGGGTFIGLSKVLKKSGACNIFLYVTHGIFSKGLSVLQPHFSHVYCYHTMLDEDQIERNFLTILNNQDNFYEHKSVNGNRLL